MPNYLVQSVPASQYAEALLEGQAESAVMPGLRADGTIRVVNIAIRSIQNLAWQVEQLDANGNVLGVYRFATGDAVPKTVSGTTYYYYTFTPGEPWTVPFTKSYQSTWAVRNTSSDSKLAGSNGELTVFLKTCVG